MSYATAQDMVDLFGEREIVELTNLDNPTQSGIDTIRLQAALDYASQEVDSYISVRYDLPLASVPLVLKNKVADIARYHLDSYRVRDDVRMRYEDAVAWLKLVAKGDASLGLDENSTSVEPQGTTDYFAANRVFDHNTLDNYVGNH